MGDINPETHHASEMFTGDTNLENSSSRCTFRMANIIIKPDSTSRTVDCRNSRSRIILIRSCRQLVCVCVGAWWAASLFLDEVSAGWNGDSFFVVGCYIPWYSGCERGSFTNPFGVVTFRNYSRSFIRSY